MLLTTRKRLHGKCLDIEDQIRGLFKAFGLRVGPVARARYRARVRGLRANQARLLMVAEPLLGHARHD